MAHAESRLGLVDSNRSQVCHEIGELKADIVILRTNNSSLGKEKDKLVVSETLEFSVMNSQDNLTVLQHDLEKKTEKLFQLENQIDKLKNRNMELESQISMTNRQLE